MIKVIFRYAKVWLNNSLCHHCIFFVVVEYFRRKKSLLKKRRRKRQDIKPYLFISYHIFYVHPWDISRISWRGGYQKRYQGGPRELKRRSKIFLDLLLF